MTRLLSACLTLVVLTPPLLARAAAQPPQKYRLSEAAAVGDVSEEEATTSSSMKLLLTIMGSEIEEGLSWRTHEKYRDEVLAVDASGATTAFRRTYITKRETSREPGEAEQRKTSSLQGKTVEVRRAGGKVTIKVAKGSISAEDRKDLEEELLGKMPRFFPDREVSVGEGWDVDPSHAAAIFSDADAKVERATIKGRLEGIVQHGGRPCARVKVTLAVTLRSKEMPVPFTFDLSGEVLHALDLQRSLSMELTGRMSLKGSITEESGMTTSFDGEGPARMRMSARWLKVAGKPVKPATGGAAGP